jgi:hypothetical protein
MQSQVSTPSPGGSFHPVILLTSFPETFRDASFAHPNADSQTLAPAAAGTKVLLMIVMIDD